MSMPAQNRAARINSTINVTPMVDVMLVLLIIFMVIMPMLRPGIPVQMASTSNPVDLSDANHPGALIVAVMHDGRMYLGNESVTAEDLTEKVRQRLSSRSNKIVYVRADARARFKFLVTAVDDVRSAGVDQVGLLTEARNRLSGR